ncbi:hypothetical protein [Pseudomonas sp. UMAB-40]|uniref:hypothetical protein n=1 Tax=Pseudomonas sp. UMAB-40 TaxID=1365407 RepID=UPI001C574DEE|nr:hypothetical protein [Pseudomonas sp. UMAB-40]
MNNNNHPIGMGDSLELNDLIARALTDTQWTTQRKLIAEYLAPIIHAAQHQSEPAKLVFPSMLRKMWSGGDVGRWIANEGPLYRKPLVTYGDTATLQRIYELIGIGELARSPAALLGHLETIQRFSNYLSAVEREFFMVPGAPGDEPGDEGAEPDDDCLVNKWAAESEEQYVEQFRTALMLISKPAGEPVAHIQFGEADSGEIGDYEIEPNRKVCEALNLADNGNGTIYDLYPYPHQKAAEQ